MKEKDAGFAEKLLPVLLSTGMVLGLVLLSGRLMDVLRTREQMNQIARAYMLVMESEGCINSANLRGLREDLESEGLTDISFSGTTTTPVDYGDFISRTYCISLIKDERSTRLRSSLLSAVRPTKGISRCISPQCKNFKCVLLSPIKVLLRWFIFNLL